MGFFNTKKVHSVNATSMRVIEDDLVPNSVKQGIVTSLFSNDGQLVENVVEGLITCIGSKAHRMYNYGKTKYTYGVPSSTQALSDTGRVEVETLIESIYGAMASVVYYNFGPLNNLHMGWLSLVNDHGYQSSTNTLGVLSAAKDTPVYLKDMQVVLTQASQDQLGGVGIEQWGIAPNSGYTPQYEASPIAVTTHTPYAVNPTATEDTVLVTYVWEETVNILVDGKPVVIAGVTQTKKELHTDTLVIPFPILDFGTEDDDYHHVKYSIDGIDKYWVYKHGIGSFPVLDNLFNTEHDSALGSFFPIAYFRYDNTSASADTTTEGYKTSKRLVKYLGIDYEDMIDSIHENPDIDEVEQAILMMAVPAKTTNQVEQRYLYAFFDRVAAESGVIVNATSVLVDDITSLSNFEGQSSLPKISFTVEDARFKMVFGCDTISRTKKAGVIAEVGEYNSLYGTVDYSTTTPVVDQMGFPVLDETTGEPLTTTKEYKIPTHYYQYQLSDSVYEEIAVRRLQMQYYIWEGMTSVGDEDDALLLIPLDYSVTKEYSIPVREELYARSLHFVFTSHVITKVKWYQKSAFKIIFIIVAVIILIVTQGASLKATIAAWLAMSATELIWALLVMIIKYFVVAELMKLFVKLVGTKAAFILAVVMVIAAAFGYLNAGSLKGVPWADSLLKLSSGLSTGIGDVIQQAFLDLQGEASAFDEYIKEQTKLLDTANDLLKTTNLLSPFVIFGESPDDFYNRTVHSGNIGVVGIDAVSYYVDNALTLPEMKDTIGDN